MASLEPEPLQIQRPDVIEVSVLHEEEIFADRAELYVTIKGSSLVTGNVALTKAREVNQLVTELTNYGLKQSDIRLQGVQTEVSTGLLGKSSSATYSLKITCAELDKLADLLGIITAQKNTTLSNITWRYSVDDEFSDNGLRDQWLDACLRRAQDKAVRIAQGLGVTLLGIHHFTEAYQGGNPRQRHYSRSDELIAQGMEGAAFSTSAYKRATRVDHEELGLEVSHSKKVVYQVDVAYRVSGFNAKFVDNQL